MRIILATGIASLEQELKVLLEKDHQVAGIYYREVFKPAILANAAAVILGHNHPSGDTAPSREDKEIVKRLAEVGKILGIEVLDSLIIGDDGNFVSFKEQGLI